jgi:hypothetical protein
MITAVFPAIVLKSGSERVSIPVEITLTYDHDTDPFAVQMIISADGEGDVVWHFDRELLLRAISSYDTTGQGDVKFRFVLPNQLLLCLRNPTGHADLGLPRARVAAFLQEVFAAVPTGTESCEVHVDELIKEILGS